ARRWKRGPFARWSWRPWPRGPPARPPPRRRSCRGDCAGKRAGSWHLRRAVRHVAFRALAGVMVLAHDLFVPFRPRRIGFVAPEARRVTAPLYIVLPGILRVRFARAMTRLTGKALVLML